MRRWLAASVWLLCATAHASTPVAIDREGTQLQLSGLAQQVADLQWALSNMGALRNPPIAEALARIQRNVAELQKRIAAAPQIAQPPPHATPPSAPLIDEAALAELIRSMGNEAFANGKLRVLDQAVPAYSFSVAQLVRVVNQLTFSQDKLRAVELVAPRLVDRQNAYQLYEAFTFAADKERLRQILGR